MGFLTSEFDIMLIIGIATFILLVIEIFVSMHERNVMKDDIAFIWDVTSDLCNEKEEKETSSPFAEATNAFKRLSDALNRKPIKCYTKMSANEYQNLAMRTNDGKCTDRLLDKVAMIEFFEEAKGGRLCGKYDFGGIINASMGLSGEVGELNDFLKKWVFHGHEMEEEKVKKEIGDVCWYVALMCESFGFELSEIMHMNIEKLKARYPEGFDPQKSINRKEGDV